MYKLLVFFIAVLLLNPSVKMDPKEIGSIDWDLSKEEIIDLYYPREPEHHGSSIRYFDIKIDQNFVVDIYYEFDGKELDRVFYRVHGKSSLFKHNKNSLPSFPEKIPYFRPIYNELLDNGYQCEIGWYYPGDKYYASYSDIKNYNICELTDDLVENVFQVFETEVLNKSYPEYRIAITMENAESSVSIYFDEYFHYKSPNPTAVEIAGIPGETVYRGIKYREWFILDFKRN